MARELGVDHLVSEIPERIPYLQAMSVLQASGIVLVMGSTDAYYHASKLYPPSCLGGPSWRSAIAIQASSASSSGREPASA